MLTGAVLNFPEKPETIAKDTRKVGPNFVIYSPQQWENLAAAIRTKSTDPTRLTVSFTTYSCLSGYKFADYKMKNKRPNIFWRLLNIPASLLVFHPLRNRFGLRRVRFAAVNDPIQSRDTFHLIHAVGIELRKTYAVTETGLIACQGLNEIDFESVGRPAVDTEVRITNSGELLVRSNSMFSGYHNELKKTAEVLIDGWCHTGDAVNINEKGRLIILNRKVP